MTWTDAPRGSRPRCSVCGEHRWAFEGHCLSTACAGPLRSPDYPLSMPDWLREQKQQKQVEAGMAPKKTATKKIKMPRKGARRSEELWYESQGKVAPWLEKQDNPT